MNADELERLITVNKFTINIISNYVIRDYSEKLNGRPRILKEASIFLECSPDRIVEFINGIPPIHFYFNNFNASISGRSILVDITSIFERERIDPLDVPSIKNYLKCIGALQE